jgi:hypothetical protein
MLVVEVNLAGVEVFVDNKCIGVASLRDEFFLKVTAEPSATGSILLQPPRAAGNRNRTATQGPPDRHACASRGRISPAMRGGNYRRSPRLPRPRGSHRGGRRRKDARGERATDRPHGHGRGLQGRAFAPHPPNVARPLHGRSLRGHLRGQCGVLQGQLLGSCGQLLGSCRAVAGARRRLPGPSPHDLLVAGGGDPRPSCEPRPAANSRPTSPGASAAPG